VSTIKDGAGGVIYLNNFSFKKNDEWSFTPKSKGEEKTFLIAATSCKGDKCADNYTPISNIVQAKIVVCGNEKIVPAKEGP